MEPLTLSRPLSLAVSLPLAPWPAGGYGWTALTSTHRGGFGLSRSVQLCCSHLGFLGVFFNVFVCLFVIVVAHRMIFLAPALTDET